MWEGAASDPNSCYVRVHLVPQSRINHRFHHLRVTLRHLQILLFSLLFEAFKNDP